MNLPVFNKLRENESTYITFSKALLDFDFAVANNGPYYYSKVVAINLPNWQSPSFYFNSSGFNDSSIGDNAEPNITVPVFLSKYVENIIRCNIHIDSSKQVEEITELAFWKGMNKLGVTDPKTLVTFVNGIFTNNFIKTENNNGWVEIVCQVPNRCKLLQTGTWKNITTVNSLVQSTYIDGLYDNGSYQYSFTSDQKNVIPFNTLTYNEITKQNFDFNCLLLFYRDYAGVDKLHGINFIYPWVNKVSYWDQERLSQVTNEARTRGFQFIFNMKTVNNQSSHDASFEQNEQVFYVNNFSKTLGELDSFLEEKIGYRYM
jgi:hypothetical protein